QSSSDNILKGIAVNGGTISGANINLYSPTNGVHVNADELNGVVNVNAAETAIQSQGGNLIIGSANLTGDPVFTNASGSLTLTIPGNTTDLSGTLNNTFSTSGADFIALASGNVTINGSGTIDASSTNGNSKIVIGAGVTFDGGHNIT